MKVQRLKDGRLRDAATGRVLKDASPQKEGDKIQKSVIRGLRSLARFASDSKMAGKELSKINQAMKLIQSINTMNFRPF